MIDNDPTQHLIDALERADPKEWAKVLYGCPIFRAHKVYEVDDGSGAGTKKLVVVPEGEAAPAGGVCIHTVDLARLRQITDEINRNYAEGGKPVKLFIGHSDPKVPQKLNPEIVGYGRRAYLGKFGPKKIDAIKTDMFFTLGNESVASKYPERSAEFNPRTNAITGVANLRTDPRLPMGMLAFATQDEVLFYGEGFMAETLDYAATAHKPAGEGGGQFTATQAASKVANQAAAKPAGSPSAPAVGSVAKAPGAKGPRTPGGHAKVASKKAFESGFEAYRHSSHATATGQPKDYATAITAHQEASTHHQNAAELHRAAGDEKKHAYHQTVAGQHAFHAESHKENAIGEPATYYGEDDMPDETIDNAFPDKKVAAPEAPAKEPGEEPVPEEADKPENEGELSPAGAPEPFQPHEINFGDRFLAHYGCTGAALKHLGGEHKKYLDAQAAMAQPAAQPGQVPAAASATDGYTPEGGSKKKPTPDESMNMSDQERLDYAETKAKLAKIETEASDDKKRIAALENENAVLYATEAIDDLIAKGKVIKDKPKEIAKLVAMTTLAQRQERLEEIKLNYADAERSPARTGGSWIRTDDGHVEGAVTPEPVEPPAATEVLQYGEENNIDISTDAGIAKATKALIAAKQKAA